jgi:hypothetical protein
MAAAKSRRQAQAAHNTVLITAAEEEAGFIARIKNEYTQFERVVKSKRLASQRSLKPRRKKEAVTPETHDWYICVWGQRQFF